MLTPRFSPRPGNALGPMARMWCTVRWLDEQQLRTVGELDEVGGVDDALDLVVQVVLGEVHHVGGHPAGPQMPAGGDDLLEELGDVGHADVGDLLAHHVGGHGGHPRDAASPCGMWVAVLPSGVNLRLPIRDLVMMSKPQKVKNRWVSTPSPSAALARTRP